MKHRHLALLCGLVGVGICTAQTSVRPYRNQNNQFVGVSVPTALDEPTITWSTNTLGWRTCTITFSETVSFAGANASVELYFDAIPGGSKFDHGVVAPLGSYTYKSSPNIVAGQSKVVRMSDYTVIDSATVSTTATSISISYPTAMLGVEPSLVQLRYLPTTVSLENTWTELNSAPTYRYKLYEGAGGTTIAYPQVPFDSAPAQALWFGAGALFVMQVPPPELPDGNEEDEELQQDKEIQLPPNFGPGDPSQSGGPTRWQPMPQPLPAGVIEVDLDGDGIKDDYILPGHDPMPHTGGMMLGYYVVDNSAIVVVIGKDTNQNGRIDPNEIIAVVGECKYQDAVNQVGMGITGGHTVVEWINKKLNPNGSDTPPGKSEIIYRYDFTTGDITVWIYDDQGRLMVYNEQGQLVVRDPQPGPNEYPPTWKGKPKDYPGWVKGQNLPKPPTGPGGPGGPGGGSMDDVFLA